MVVRYGPRAYMAWRPLRGDRADTPFWPASCATAQLLLLLSQRATLLPASEREQLGERLQALLPSGNEGWALLAPGQRLATAAVRPAAAPAAAAAAPAAAAAAGAAAAPAAAAAGHPPLQQWTPRPCEMPNFWIRVVQVGAQLQGALTVHRPQAPALLAACQPSLTPSAAPPLPLRLQFCFAICAFAPVAQVRCQCDGLAAVADGMHCRRHPPAAPPPPQTMSRSVLGTRQSISPSGVEFPRWCSHRSSFART